jgi:hypothetical protein
MLFALLGCPRAAEPPPVPEVTVAPRSELEDNLAAARLPGGAPPDLRRHENALAWLLAHPEEAFPRVLAAVESDPSDVVLVDLLGRFRQPGATHALKAAFAAGDPARRYAAAGLGQSPDPAARAFLMATLDGDRGAVVAGLAGLGVSGDPSACAAVRSKLGAVEGEVRWAAVDAGKRLGCVTPAELKRIALEDADPDVRKLASE